VCFKCAHAKISCDWGGPVKARRPTGTPKQPTATRTGPAPLRPAIPDHEEVADQGKSPGVESGGVEQAMILRRPTAQAMSLAKSISPKSFEMTNSLTLDEQAFRSFQYIPESLMVMRFGKPWRWSMISYVHSRVAPRDSGVMSAFVAVAQMELRFRELINYEGSIVSKTRCDHAMQLRASAGQYLHLALQSLLSLLDKLSTSDPSPEDLEALFAMWFLILHCGLYDSDMIQTCEMHLNGIRSFISDYIERNNSSGGKRLPPAAQQLLLFIS
jgi:hypothetical protein